MRGTSHSSIIETPLTHMASHTPLAMIIVDPLSDSLIDANPAACHLLLLARDQTLTTPLQSPLERLTAAMGQLYRRGTNDRARVVG